MAKPTQTSQNSNPGQAVSDPLKKLPALDLGKPQPSSPVKPVPDKPLVHPGPSGYSRNNFSRNSTGRAIKAVDQKEVEGVLDIIQEGHGFVRPGFKPSNNDIYISPSQIRRFKLRTGDWIKGVARQPKNNERYWGLLQVSTVNGIDISGGNFNLKRRYFHSLVPVYPFEQIKLEIGPTPLTNRVIDLIAPIGKGQRGLIVSPPKAGKTTILKQVAQGISQNYPKIKIMAVLVGERPEEVTDLARNIKGVVVASNFDETPETQTKLASLALERAKRLVEMGNDVVILLDSITRLARAYNLVSPPSGRTLSGGFDPIALYPPKKFFGAARCFEDGGSLTILGTSLVETGSRMDDLIYEEFKGTGNMELHLSRSLAERRIFPAIDVQRSGTRKEELLFQPAEYKKIVTLRRVLDMLSTEERTDLFLQRLAKSKSNKEFMDNLNKLR